MRTSERVEGDAREYQNAEVVMRDWPRANVDQEKRRDFDGTLLVFARIPTLINCRECNRIIRTTYFDYVDYPWLWNGFCRKRCADSYKNKRQEVLNLL